MAYRIYRHDDPGAVAAGLPILPRDAGATYSSRAALVTILDACLVNGYAGKAPAGWTKPFPSNGTQDLYQSQSTTGFALRVEPQFTSGANTYCCNQVSGVVSPTSLTHAGTGTTLVGTGSMSGGAWIIFADEKSFFILSKGDAALSLTSGLWQLCYFGEVVPYDGLAPGTNWVCIGRIFSTSNYAHGATWSSSHPSSLASTSPVPRIIHPLYAIDAIRIIGGQFFLATGSAQYQVPLSATGGRVITSDVILTGNRTPICKLRGMKTLESAFWGTSAPLDILTLDGKKYAIVYTRGQIGSVGTAMADESMFLIEVE